MSQLNYMFTAIYHYYIMFYLVMLINSHNKQHILVYANYYGSYDVNMNIGVHYLSSLTCFVSNPFFNRVEIQKT